MLITDVVAIMDAILFDGLAGRSGSGSGRGSGRVVISSSSSASQLSQFPIVDIAHIFQLQKKKKKKVR